MILYNIGYYYILLSFGVGFYEIFTEKYRAYQLTKRINYNYERNKKRY